MVDDIGPQIYEPWRGANCAETWQLLLKPRLSRNASSSERFKLVTRYVGNGGNPVMLAEWLRLTGALGNPGNVEEVCDLLKQLMNDTLRPDGAPHKRFKVYNWDARRLVSVPISAHSDADKELYMDAIAALRGWRDTPRLALVPEQWREVALPESDLFHMGWTEDDL